MNTIDVNTNDDLKEMFDFFYKDKIEHTLDMMIRYLRNEEKQEKGMGIETLNIMLKDGSMKMDLYLKIRECVENPYTPYEIILT